jgi:hypothetical protein
MLHEWGRGGDPLEFLKESAHRARVDGVIVPAHPVASGDKVATDLPVSHATDELPPGRLILSGELHTGAGGVVQELIVLNPEGGVPGFVVGVTVVGLGGHERLSELKSV